MPGPPAAYDGDPSTYGGSPDTPDGPSYSAPSRASPGGGYHTADGGLTPQVYGLMGANPDSSWVQTPQGKFARNLAWGGKIASVATGIPGLGLLGFALGNRYTPEAREWNEGRMRAGLPHHDPETGVWTSETLAAGLDPRSWHPGPVRGYSESQGMYGENIPDGGGLPALAATGAPAAAQPADPAGLGLADAFELPAPPDAAGGGENEMLERILRRRQQMAAAERELLLAEAPGVSGTWLPTA